MAYPARGRDPLLDATTQAYLIKRGSEVAGVLLLLLSIYLVLTLASYSSGDQGLMIIGTSVHNWMGHFGAKIAAPLMKLLGHGAWSLPVLFAGWGLRLVAHSAQDWLAKRAMYGPIAIAVTSIYVATLPPSADWAHNFSMGGRFGDTVLLIILQIIPGSAEIGAKVVALILGLTSIWLYLFVLGVTLKELFTWFVRLSQIGALGITKAISAVSQAKAGRQNTPHGTPIVHSHARTSVVRAAPVAQYALDDEVSDPAETQSLFRRMPSLLKRPAQEPESTESEEDVFEDFDLSLGGDIDAEMDQEDRVRAKINSAIKSRIRLRMTAPPAAQPMMMQARPEHAHPRQTPVMPSVPVSGPLNLSLPPVVNYTPAVHPVVESSPELALEPSQKAGPKLGPQSGPERQSRDATDNIFADDGVGVDLQQVTEDEEFLAQPMPKVRVVPVPQAVQPSCVPASPKIQPVASKFQPVVQATPLSKATVFEKPPVSLLMSPDLIERHILSDEALEQNARILENVLDDYGIKGEIVSVRPGPVVTMYELEPAPGLKASRVIGLADDIARSMSALSARVSTVPGRSVIGIELPNDNREMVALREILSTRGFSDPSVKLPLALGKDIGGEPIVANLAKMPHLLIAGTTGSGKSVAINTMILSLLYRLTPDECRLIMIDPKMLELSVYDGIPHLLSPVVTDPKKAVVALKWVVGEMEDRYRKMSKMGVRNIDGYNGRVADAIAKNEMFSRTVQTGFEDETGEPVFETEEFAPEKLPYIVVVVDEMADLMMVAGKEIEACIQRLAQMARASGIHLIMATQRPSVDVITGTIKANFPTRISFQVTSKIDSRTILGEMGAEQLLGQGDMLYMEGGGKVTRVHGPFCSDEEVEEIVNYLKAYGPPDYVGGVVEGPDESKSNNIDAVLGLGGNTDQEDALYDTAVQIVAKDRKCSTSYIQRKLAIGYNKAARLVEQMEDNGLVSAANHVGKREILMPEQG